MTALDVFLRWAEAVVRDLGPRETQRDYRLAG